MDARIFFLPGCLVVAVAGENLLDCGVWLRLDADGRRLPGVVPVVGSLDGGGVSQYCGHSGSRLWRGWALR